ncbi:MAG: hypothetical protein ACO3FW_07485, partial [Burkholderiaceae bacterium]
MNGLGLKTSSIAVIGLVALGFNPQGVNAQALAIPQFNPSLSEGGRALLAPASSFSGPQTFNPSMSPESRVLLAPVPKPKPVKKKTATKSDQAIQKEGGAAASVSASAPLEKTES